MSADIGWIDGRVLYEDNHLIAVAKPPGISSQEDASGDADMLSLLKQYLKEKYNKPGNVYLGLLHRLDRPTGGAMVFAKTSKAASRMSDAIRRRVLLKSYLAVTTAAPRKQQGVLVHYLAKDRDTNTSAVFDTPGPGRKEASLAYRVLNRHADMALLGIRLDTGRSHQIRAQLAAAGCPVHGDGKYGGRQRSTTCLGLWSVCLEFDHPVKDERVVITSTPPQAHPWGKFAIPESLCLLPAPGV